MERKEYQVLIETNPELIAKLLADIEILITKIQHVDNNISTVSDFDWQFDDLTLMKCRSYIRDIRDAVK